MSLPPSWTAVPPSTQVLVEGWGKLFIMAASETLSWEPAEGAVDIDLQGRGWELPPKNACKTAPSSRGKAGPSCAHSTEAGRSNHQLYLRLPQTLTAFTCNPVVSGQNSFLPWKHLLKINKNNE